MKRNQIPLTDDNDYLDVRANIRELIRDNRKSRGKQFIWYIKLLKEIKREVDDHLKNKGIK